MKDTLGYIHSFNSLGAVDGPGIRFIVFMQGCPYRCPYCHNPDTRAFSGGVPYSPLQVADKAVRYRTYFGEKGGVTVSGGEPLCQSEFVSELFELLHKRGISTCLDTAGIKPDKKVESVLAYTDTVLCDIKFPTECDYLKRVGGSLENTLEFLRLCNKMGVSVIIRHVVVPGITYKEEALEKFGEFLKTLSNVEKLEVLPYHTLGENKYEKMGIEYPLKGVPQLSKEDAVRAENIIRKSWGKELLRTEENTTTDKTGGIVCRTC